MEEDAIMKTYRFYANMLTSVEIEVEADNYDDAFDLAYAKANDNYRVLAPIGWYYFDDIQIEDSDYLDDED